MSHFRAGAGFIIPDFAKCTDIAGKGFEAMYEKSCDWIDSENKETLTSHRNTGFLIRFGAGFAGFSALVALAFWLLSFFLDYLTVIPFLLYFPVAVLYTLLGVGQAYIGLSVFLFYFFTGMLVGTFYRARKFVGKSGTAPSVFMAYGIALIVMILIQAIISSVILRGID